LHLRKKRGQNPSVKVSGEPTTATEEQNEESAPGQRTVDKGPNKRHKTSSQAALEQKQNRGVLAGVVVSAPPGLLGPLFGGCGPQRLLRPLCGFSCVFLGFGLSPSFSLLGCWLPPNHQATSTAGCSAQATTSGSRLLQRAPSCSSLHLSLLHSCRLAVLAVLAPPAPRPLPALGSECKSNAHRDARIIGEVYDSSRHRVLLIAHNEPAKTGGLGSPTNDTLSAKLQGEKTRVVRGLTAGALEVAKRPSRQTTHSD
jgi:hypothetical protein